MCCTLSLPIASNHFRIGGIGGRLVVVAPESGIRAGVVQGRPLKQMDRKVMKDVVHHKLVHDGVLCHKGQDPGDVGRFLLKAIPQCPEENKQSNKHSLTPLSSAPLPLNWHQFGTRGQHMGEHEWVVFSPQVVVGETVAQ